MCVFERRPHRKRFRRGLLLCVDLFALQLAPGGELRLGELVGLHQRPVRGTAERAAAALHAEVDLQVHQTLNVALLISRLHLAWHQAQRTVRDALAALDADIRVDGTERVVS